MTEIEVDAVIDLNSPDDMHVAFSDIVANEYISHETKGQNLVLVTTKNGVIGVQADNPTLIFGLIVNIHNIKRKALLEEIDG